MLNNTNTLIGVFSKNGLSTRESEVASLVSTGLSNREVADKLFVTEKTVKFHLTNIYRKLNMRSRAQLIVWSLPHLNFAQNDQQNNQQNIPSDNRQQVPNLASNIQPVTNTLQQPIQQPTQQQNTATNNVRPITDSFGLKDSNTGEPAENDIISLLPGINNIDGSGHNSGGNAVGM